MHASDDDFGDRADVPMWGGGDKDFGGKGMNRFKPQSREPSRSERTFGVQNASSGNSANDSVVRDRRSAIKALRMSFGDPNI